MRLLNTLIATSLGGTERTERTEETEEIERTEETERIEETETERTEMTEEGNGTGTEIGRGRRRGVGDCTIDENELVSFLDG